MTKSIVKDEKSSILQLIEDKETFNGKDFYVIFSVNDQSPHVEAEIEKLKKKDSDLEGYEGYDDLPLEAYFIDFSHEVDNVGYGILEFNGIFKTLPQPEQTHNDFEICKNEKTYLGLSASKIENDRGLWQNAAKAFYMAKNKQSSFMPLTQFIDDFLINAAKDAGMYKVK
jgi:hypothetical protein